MSPYQRFVDNLSDEQLELIMRGELGIGCNDENYCLVEKGYFPLEEAIDEDNVRSILRDNEDEVLSQLYRNQPLCRAEFDYQAVKLIEVHGAAHFCHDSNNPRGWALMIDEANLIAVGPDDVRSQYGYFCECDSLMWEKEAAAKVMKWLESGDAYNDYRSKTTCRYC